MYAQAGWTVAITTPDFEIHMKSAGGKAMAVYPADITNMAAQRRIQAVIWGLGYVHVVGSGEVDVPDSETGLTGWLGWDHFSAA